MNYCRYRPSDALTHLVRYYWSFDIREYSIEQICIRSFADKYPRLIFQDIDEYGPLRSASGEAMPMCYLSGVDTKPTQAMVAGAFSHFGVSFYPHALTAFFGIGADELVNAMPDIRLICSDRVDERLRNTTHTNRVVVMNRYLSEKLRTSSSSDYLVQNIIQHDSTSDRELHRLPSRYKISERQLQRRFKTHVGVSLKKYQRISRFEATLQQLAAADYRQLASIACAMDYTDQSHFIKEFNEFAGMSPYRFVRNKSVGAESSSYLYVPD